MNEDFFMAGFLDFFCLTAMAKTGPIYPIPSYNIPVASGHALFQKRRHVVSLDITRENREVNFKIIRPLPGLSDCHSQVWIYSLDGVDTLGPYMVQCGETLTVEIDEREWGVLVETESDILVDVWIE
jgi:hypothetical protein